MRIGYNEVVITSTYFNDFINLEIRIKRFQGNMEQFHFNPFPLNAYSRRLFPNIETFHIYNKYGEIFNDGRIFKEININKDRDKYGNTIPPEVKSLESECFYNCVH
ncbi:hypothetical protein EDI_071970 [Entamoeba dispar SAW760]|uniref:Uncharacterized protein n=1 Tax=Entamoeba dispar (strain ATCC PRA-260 / SAW760) TaxID=370354 RepID=B0EEY2_ENTDS|nr:uncharacterized protein EDI_071970 [Entamoeba dispar SAW760]EDR26914.1 hypothetical protein EDI_071970 [Entamoeba dispar SAW760]|eukprot:EDR26914.1 hypothetical protein EDI_071970 [Entamoeba dispar SAW760]